jgi:hypothetical protein
MLNIDATGLNVGNYFYRLTISDPNAQNNPISILITFYLVGDNCWTGDAASRAVWESVGKPKCWCAGFNPRQCHGDADGVQSPADKTGIPPAHWVGSPDLGTLALGWKKPRTNPNFNIFICADFDRIENPGDKSGLPPHRVGAPDLGILTAWWKKGNVPANCQDKIGRQE